MSHPSIAGHVTWPLAKPVVRPTTPWLERIFAGCLLIPISPVVGMVLLAVWLLSGRAPLIAHRRVGQYGAKFWMLKIRTMWDRRPVRLSGIPKSGWIEHLVETSIPVAKNTADPRVTSRFAALCRRFSLDELPQLLHVMNGEMRLVGPRPITSLEWNTYYGDSAIAVLSIAPGVTGLWQIKGRNRLTYAQRRRLDLFYARHRSLFLDLMILWRTPGRVLSGRDAC